MNNKKLLSVAILCVLAKSALGIEIEPNNDSKTANKLGLENVGQLSKGSDVDFFSIDNSCIKYTADDQKNDSTHTSGTCVTYTADDQIADPTNIEGEDKYRSEISLAFSCNSRAAVGKGGWYLGVHDSRGVLQATYQVNSTDCMTGATGSAGPYSFKFPSSRDIPNYYLSVVADCHLPIYNSSSLDPLKPVVSANTFVQSTATTKTDIDAAQAEITKAKKVLVAATSALNDANFSMIGSNDSIAKGNDAILMAKDIADQSKPNLTAATTINAVSSTAKAVGIMASAMNYSIQSHNIFLIADAAAKNAADNVATELAQPIPNEVEKARLKEIKTNSNDAKTAAAADNSDATIKLDLANTALANAVTVLNTTVNADITAANAATDSGSRTNNSCEVSNNATYTIKDNLDNSPKITPYQEIASKKPPALGLQSSQQTGSAYDVDFFEITGNSKIEIPLEFSCTKNSAKGSTEGWVVSAWTNDKDKPEFAYQISPKDCNSASPYELKLPKYTGSYYLGIQSACALAPTDKATALQLIYYNLAGNPTDSASNFLCDINTASFTIKQGEIGTFLDLSKLSTSNQLISSQKGTLKVATDSNLYYIDSTNPKNDIPLLFSCTKNAKRFTNDWKLSVYNEAKVLLSSQLINGSACGEGLDGDTGAYKFTLPSGSSRYYLSVSSACTDATDTTCYLEKTEYSISRDVIPAPVTTTGTIPKIETITPYLDMTSKLPLALKAQTRGRLNNLKTVNLYSLASSLLQDVQLEFSCDKTKAIGNDFGWVMTVWDHDNADKTKTDLLQAAYEIKPTDCDNSAAAATYKVTIPSSANVSYVGIQSICLPVPTENKSALDTTAYATCKVNTGYYTIKSDFNAKLDSAALKTAVPLSTDKSGQINAPTDNDIYVVESDGTAEIPMIFSCSAMAVRQMDDWKLSIYDDANELVTGYPIQINGSNCGAGFKGDKGGYKFTLPKNSLRYYLSVKSACNQQDCVDTSEYNIARDVIKTYTGILATSKTVTSKTANFKITKCGASANATIAVKAENVNLSKKLNPINIQIGGMVCQTAMPTVANSLMGTVVNPSTLFDSSLIAKDRMTIVLSDCGTTKGKVTLTGTGLDLENLNFDNVPNSVLIPVKVDLGDFHCQGKDLFYMSTNATDDISYTNSVPKVDVPVVTTPVDTTPIIVTPPVVIVDPIVTALTVAKNVGVSQTNKLNSVTDIQAYYVDTGSSQTDVNFELNCPNSTRFTNDWTLSIYDAQKTFVSTKIINGSDCGTGQTGDSGAFLFTVSKSSPRSYMVIKSACESGDATCVVDSSQYEIKRIIPVKAATTGTSTSTCLIGSCTTTTVKPFFK